ncbi:MAG TPA: hypothetical protein VK638_25930, partial [Edaphobacter sp.]|nr:hypothetical protein [Edaphobacter sp.]
CGAAEREVFVSLADRCAVQTKVPHGSDQPINIFMGVVKREGGTNGALGPPAPLKIVFPLRDYHSSTCSCQIRLPNTLLH